jgi:DNA-binding transcriptional ArsR family regulator
MRRDVFQAISDPTRRQIIHMISSQSLNINAVSENFGVSRTAIYKHIKILTECGLVSIKQQGRERFCEARLEKLGEVSDWVEQNRKVWTERLDALEDYLQVLQSTKGQPATNQHQSTKNKKNAKGKPSC